jgi:hypothetical protein
LSIVKNLKKAVLFVSLLSLLGSTGVAPFCSSCGPKVMDCCKGDSSRAESLNETPCCDFRMSVTAEPHPARMTPHDTRSLPNEALRAATQAASGCIAAPEPTPAPDSSAGQVPSPSPPLFLLNASFLC